MTSINIIFDVPAEIARGLADGSLERIGGVIRKADAKTVVVWLTELGGGPEEEKGIPSILTNPQALMGVQVANLAVNTAGFALMYQKLKNVEHQLNDIDQKLSYLSSDQSWLDKKQLIAQLSPVMAAVSMLDRNSKINDVSIIRDKLVSADNILAEKSIYFRQMLGDMLVDKLEQERPDEFFACYQAWIMASQGCVQTMTELGEIDEAHARADIFKLEHQAFGREFLKVRRNPLRKLSNERAKNHAEKLLEQLGQQCAGAHDIIKGKVLQLEYMKDNGMKLEDIPDLSKEFKRGYALLRFGK